MTMERIKDEKQPQKSSRHSIYFYYDHPPTHTACEARSTRLPHIIPLTASVEGLQGEYTFSVSGSDPAILNAMKEAPPITKTCEKCHAQLQRSLPLTSDNLEIITQ